jgi:hypothetical protein
MNEGRLAELLLSAGTAWTTAQGNWRHWCRQGLVTVAFRRHFDQLDATGLRTRSISFRREERPESEPDPVIETVRTVCIDRPGRRARVDLLSWHGEELRADVVVWDRDTFWARTGDDLLTNHGDLTMGHGGDEVTALLQPDYVTALYELTPEDTSVVAGRPCLRAAARKRAGVTDRERDPFRVDPFGMVAGGEDFVLDIDRATGLLLRVTKLVDGAEAEIMEWTELTLDAPLDDALFAPLR